MPHVLFFYGGFGKSRLTLGGCSTQKRLRKWPIQGCAKPAATRASVCHPSQPRRLPPAPALNSDEVESCRKCCINKARDSLTAPIRDRVLSRRWLRAAAGRWPSGRERGSGAPPASPEQWCRASAPPAAAAPRQPALLTWPGRRGGRGRACSSLGSNRPCARRPGEPAARAPRAKAGAGDGVGEESAREALSQHWCIASRRRGAWDQGAHPLLPLQARLPPNLGTSSSLTVSLPQSQG